MRLILKRFSGDQLGVAATEFALIAPLLIVTFLGVVELCNFTMQSRRAQQAATLAAEFMSRDGDNVLRTSERHVVEDIWMIVNPTAYASRVLRDGEWANGYSRALSSITFENADGCVGNDCELVAAVQWSFLFRDIIAKPVSMSCDAKISEGGSIGGSSIPAGLVGRAPIVVANLTYPYFPLIKGWLIPAVELHVNAVRKTRNGVPLRSDADGFVTQC